MAGERAQRYDLRGARGDGYLVRAELVRLGGSHVPFQDLQGRADLEGGVLRAPSAGPRHQRGMFRGRAARLAPAGVIYRGARHLQDVRAPMILCITKGRPFHAHLCDARGRALSPARGKSRRDAGGEAQLLRQYHEQMQLRLHVLPAAEKANGGAFDALVPRAGADGGRAQGGA